MTTTCDPLPARANGLLADGPWALFLDIDGTLFDLMNHPEAVRADAASLSLLDRLVERLDGAFALVSGRDLDCIDRVTAPRLYPAAGSHGCEWRGIAGGTPPLDADALAKLRDAVADVDRWIAGEESLSQDQKPYSLGIRDGGKAEARAMALDFAQRALAQLGAGWRIIPGKDLVEIVPAQSDKGLVIERFLRHPPYRGRRPIFAGDDVTDESGFGAVNRADGVSIRIGGDGPTQARWRLSSPTALRTWLADNFL